MTSDGPSISLGHLDRRLRENPWKPGWLRIDWMSDGQAATAVACSFSTRSSAASGSKRSSQSTVNPLCSAPPSTKVPPIQKNGNAQRILRGPSEPLVALRLAALNAAVVRTIDEWEWTTPLGSALEPDV